MMKVVGFVVVVAIAAVLLLATRQPATFRVERTTTINASPEKVAGLVNDFHNWEGWSPWAKLDPKMTTTYSGAPSGVGQVYAWSGNSKVGSGQMEILGIIPAGNTAQAAAPQAGDYHMVIEPAQTIIKLDFLKPMEGHNTATFLYEPQGSGTRVTWVMTGPNNYMAKVVHVFVSMDTIIGGDFAKGLANLKAEAEK